MPDDLDLRLLQLTGAGYCCTQIMLLLALEELDRTNPDLVRAAAGLCQGMGDCGGPCGILTGGALALGLHAGKGQDAETADDRLPLLLSEFTEWFTDTAAGKYGGVRCVDILGGECGAPHPDRCGSLLALAREQVRRILVDNGLDPAEGRELPDA
ncbi:MAG: DVU_1555 family C-GCAxxG-C-C protein [Desulfovibrionaceae bacterium]